MRIVTRSDLKADSPYGLTHGPKHHEARPPIRRCACRLGSASAYSPTLDRAIYAVALLGILVVTHLAVQVGRRF